MKVLFVGGKIAGGFFGNLVNMLEDNGIGHSCVEPTDHPEFLTEASEGHEAVITFYPLDADRIAALAPSVKGLIVTSIGYDTIDLAAANARGIMVCNIPDYSTEEVALHSVTLLLASLRNLCLYDRSIREGKWQDRSMVCGRHRHRLSTLTLGFLGFGRIGQKAAEMMSGFGVEMIGYDPYLPDSVFEEKHVKRVSSTNEIYAQSDLISLYMPLNDETYHLIDRDSISQMKDGVIIVNVARGALLNLEAVTEALRDGKIGAAGIDVWEQEPISMDAPVLLEDNAIVTPHCAYFSIESGLDLRKKSLTMAMAICKGEIPYNCVNKSALGIG